MDPTFVYIWKIDQNYSESLLNTNFIYRLDIYISHIIGHSYQITGLMQYGIFLIDFNNHRSPSLKLTTVCQLNINRLLWYFLPMTVHHNLLCIVAFILEVCGIYFRKWSRIFGQESSWAKACGSGYPPHQNFISVIHKGWIYGKYL